MNEKPTARQRSAFGAFQMGTSHIKSRVNEVIPQAKATDMAEMRREGRSFEEIGEALGLAASTVRSRMSIAGFKSNGQPAKPRQ